MGDSMVCPRCNATTLQQSCIHALCCSRSESTKGHYCVRDEVLALVHLADSSASTEIRELIPDRPNLRPADIFTSAAIPGRMAALDIGICSPDAGHAGDDCCEEMMRAKLRTYSLYESSLNAQGITYKPLVFSCYGRCHPDCVLTLDYVARRAARQRGLCNFTGLLHRARRNISVAIWRRAAKMVHACLPQQSRESTDLLFGVDPSQSRVEEGTADRIVVRSGDAAWTA